MNISIKCPKMYSSNIQNESTQLRAKNFTLKIYSNDQIFRFKNLNFEIRSHRVQLNNNKDCYDIMFDRIKNFTFLKRGLFSKILYKIKIEYDNCDIFEIKKDNREKILNEYKIFEQHYSTMNWKIVKGGESNFDYGNNKNKNNLEKMFEKKKKNFQEKDINAEMYLNNIDDIFNYFDELKDIFQYFKTKKNPNNQKNQKLDQLMQNLGNRKLVSKTDNIQNFSKKLAQDISFTFQNYLKTNYFIISLIEAFTEYNTLKGIDLITPKDFIEGCENLSAVDSQVILRELENGVKILCFRDFERREHFEGFLGGFLRRDGFLTQEGVAREFGISVSLARIMLDIYSESGFLVVDDYIQGKSFYRNDLWSGK